MRENVRHEEESVRLAAVNWLLGRRALLRNLAPDLESLLTAKPAGVARHAAFLLGKIGPEAAPRLLAGLRREDSRIDQIAEALAQMGRPVVGLLSRAITAPEARVRRGSALALGQIRPLPPGIARKLAAGLRDPDRAVRAAFLTAIGYLGTRAGDSAPAVRELLKDESAEIRVQAIAVLSQSARATPASSPISPRCSTTPTPGCSGNRSTRFAPWARSVVNRCRSSSAS